MRRELTRSAAGAQLFDRDALERFLAFAAPQQCSICLTALPGASERSACKCCDSAGSPVRRQDGYGSEAAYKTMQRCADTITMTACAC